MEYFKNCKNCHCENLLPAKYCSQCKFEFSIDTIIKKNSEEIVIHKIPLPRQLTSDFYPIDNNHIIYKNLQKLYLISFYSQNEYYHFEWKLQNISGGEIIACYANTFHLFVIVKRENNFYLCAFYKDFLTDRTLSGLNNIICLEKKLPQASDIFLSKDHLCLVNSNTIEILYLDASNLKECTESTSVIPLDYPVDKNSFVESDDYYFYVSDKNKLCFINKNNYGLKNSKDLAGGVSKIICHGDLVLVLLDNGELFRCEIWDNGNILPDKIIQDYKVSDAVIIYYNNLINVICLNHNASEINVYNATNFQLIKNIKGGHGFFEGYILKNDKSIVVQFMNTELNSYDTIAYDIHSQYQNRIFSSLTRDIRFTKVHSTKIIFSTVFCLVEDENNEKHIIKIDL